MLGAKRDCYQDPFSFLQLAKITPGSTSCAIFTGLGCRGPKKLSQANQLARHQTSTFQCSDLVEASEVQGGRVPKILGGF